MSEYTKYSENTVKGPKSSVMIRIHAKPIYCMCLVSYAHGCKDKDKVEWLLGTDPFIPKSDQFQIPPAALSET